MKQLLLHRSPLDFQRARRSLQLRSKARVQEPFRESSALRSRRTLKTWLMLARKRWGTCSSSVCGSNFSRFSSQSWTYLGLPNTIASWQPFCHQSTPSPFFPMVAATRFLCYLLQIRTLLILKEWNFQVWCWHGHGVGFVCEERNRYCTISFIVKRGKVNSREDR